MEVEKEKRKDILTEIKKNKKEMAVIDIVTAKSDVSRIKKMNKEINSFGSLEFVEKNLKDKMELFDLKNKLGQEVGKSINLLKENSEKAKRNAKISLEIKELEKEKSHLVVSEDETRDAISYVSARTTSLKEKFKDTKAQYDKYKEYKEEFESYTYFLKAMSKDGLPKQIIENNLHIINSEIKKILANNVNFTIVLEGGDIYFNYSKGQKRKIELSSGMEKTVAAIAIRAALLGVTTLPKSNIFVLDEVFGSLDSEYIDAVSGIFEYLKTLFECIVIVTHIDAFKDIVDHSIVIERDDEGFAKISQ